MRMSYCKLIGISNNKRLLCICDSNSLVKFWDVTSNILEIEFEPGANLSTSITCLQFSPKIKTKTQKSNKIALDENKVAFGTLNGTIIIYNVDHQQVTNTFRHESLSFVSDICWKKRNELISASGKEVIIWNENGTPIFSFNTIECTSLCVLKNQTFAVANTNIRILNVSIEKKETTETTLIGHKTSVSQLLPLTPEAKSNSNYFLSSAENDRYVYVWSSKGESSEPVGSFMAKDVVMSFCSFVDEEEMTVAVTTKSGFLRIFTYPFASLSKSKVLRHTKSLKIESNSKRNQLIPILISQFLSASEMIIAYGTEVFPRCEKMNLEEITLDCSWSRDEPSILKGGRTPSLARNLTPHVPDTTLHLMPTQMKTPEIKEASGKRKKTELSLPMEDRLDSLSLTQQLTDGPGGRPLDNYVHLLTQALHSKDTSLLNSIIAKGEDEEIINNTVRRLSVSNVVPFLQYLQDVILSKGVKNLTCVKWIKSVLYQHMSHLSAVPGKEDLLHPFYSIFSSRTASLLAVSKLHARINLLLTHVKNRHENSAHLTHSTSYTEPLIKYKDDSSDEGDFVGLDGVGSGPSESSEDIWDDWTEDDDEGASDAEEGTTTRPGKRKADADVSDASDGFIAVSDSDAASDVVSSEDEENSE